MIAPNDESLKAPFPYFGGKSRMADAVWERLGDVPNYVEPFVGSCATLLRRPHEPNCETVNDLDGMVANFWRAVQSDPEAVAYHADHPVNENDLHARHAWLVGQKDSLQERLEGDPEFFDAKAAGWWCWGTCCWIGSGFCSGNGPWQVQDDKLVHLGDKGQGVYDWMERLSNRLRLVRVCCGDWSRVCTATPTVKQGLTGVFLDPPYADSANRTSDLYRKDCESVAHDVRAWAIEQGDNPKMRIALCGYEGEHDMPRYWECLAWKTKGGYASQSSQGNENATKERIWFSPHCLQVTKSLRQMELLPC